MKKDADTLIKNIIRDMQPRRLVEDAVRGYGLEGDVRLLAIGKAAWSMAKAATDVLGGAVKEGIVITKYGHSLGALPNTRIIEAGHPISDENSVLGAQKAIEMAKTLTAGDKLLLLISGGGSALFEKPQEGITLREIAELNSRLLRCGADIVEINMIRKRLSGVKAGRFAQLCGNAEIYAAVLSDVLGDRLDSIASGPAAPDLSTKDDAAAVVKKYNISLSDTMRSCLLRETPKEIANVKTKILGSVRTLCASAAKNAAALGYAPHILTLRLSCEAAEAGRFIAAMAREAGEGAYRFKRPCALIFGGETVVHMRGGGKGGRNQELALAAAAGLSGLRDVLLFSFGSDGTDGPTDAAGGMVDGESLQRLKEKGVDVYGALCRNDSYTALGKIGALIKTGPTGTNVNDAAVLLCGKRSE